MTIIEASSVKFQTLMDGTLRIVADIEPRYAQAAFALFCRPGTPMALAALKSGSQRDPEPSAAHSEEMKGGELAKLAGKWCANPEFWHWITATHGREVSNSTEAASWLRAFLAIESRRELDHDEMAARNFHENIRGPFSKYLISRGITS